MITIFVTIQTLKVESKWEAIDENAVSLMCYRKLISHFCSNSVLDNRIPYFWSNTRITLNFQFRRSIATNWQMWPRGDKVLLPVTSELQSCVLLLLRPVHVCEPNSLQMVRVCVDGIANMRCTICKWFMYHSSRTKICRFFVRTQRELWALCRQVFFMFTNCMLITCVSCIFSIWTGRCLLSANWNYGLPCVHRKLIYRTPNSDVSFAR